MFGLNEAFAQNTVGKTMSFDEQPYARGKMVITKITERRIGPIKEFYPDKGTVLMSYDVFDVEGLVIEGSYTGAFICGVPVQGSTVDTSGTTYVVKGMTRGNLYDAAWLGKVFVRATCG